MDQTIRQGVTVVVPTLNRGGFLYNCLVDLLAQTHRPLEILVVDQSEAIAPNINQMIVANPETINYHQVTFRGLPEARNYGWQHARYEAIVFVDDDIRCKPGFVGEHLEVLRQSGVGLVAGGLVENGRPHQPSSQTGVFNFWTATPYRQFPTSGSGSVDHAPGSNFSAWRVALQEAGGVDEGLNVGAALYEETELCLRIAQASYQVRFNGAAHLTHLAAAGGGCRVSNVAQYVYAMAHNRAILIRRHLTWYQCPTALLELLRLGLAYAVTYRRPQSFLSGLKGCYRGWQKALEPPKCTKYTSEHRLNSQTIMNEDGVI